MWVSSVQAFPRAASKIPGRLLSFAERSRPVATRAPALPSVATQAQAPQLPGQPQVYMRANVDVSPRSLIS
jgi:hypothetical protein